MPRPKLTRLSIDDLTRELRRRRTALGTLIRRRDSLATRLDALDSKISGLSALFDGPIGRRRGPGRPRGSRQSMGIAAGGGRRRRRRRRARNSMTLLEALRKVLKGRTMGVKEMASAVKRAGYKTTSKSFRTILSMAMVKNRKLFHRVSRGQYTAR